MLVLATAVSIWYNPVGAINISSRLQDDKHSVWSILLDTAQQLNDHERRISQLEGKLDSLATKELVLQLNAKLLEAINIKFDQQTELLRAESRTESRELREELKELRDDVQNLDQRINDQDKKYTKLAGGAVAIGLVLSILVGAANVFVAAVGAGILTIN